MERKAREGDGHEKHHKKSLNKPCFAFLLLLFYFFPAAAPQDKALGFQRPGSDTRLCRRSLGLGPSAVCQADAGSLHLPFALTGSPVRVEGAVSR